MQQLKKNFLFILCAFLAWQCSNSADAWLEQAKERLKKGELISARESIEKAIEKNPGYAEAYNLRG
jgi:Tfp pilus assembly protein PilF